MKPTCEAGCCLEKAARRYNATTAFGFSEIGRKARGLGLDGQEFPDDRPALFRGGLTWSDQDCGKDRLVRMTNLNHNKERSSFEANQL